MHKGPRGTEAVESGHVVTVGTLRAHHPGTAGTQSDTDHIVPVDAAHAFKVRGGCEGGGKGYLGSDEVAFTISTHQDQHIFSEPAAVVPTSTVRRLTPVECERLQGFPDNFTAIPWRKKGAEDCPDGPRYKALGNSMAVPVMRWIGERIQMVEDTMK